jgi:hypothetical protein
MSAFGPTGRKPIESRSLFTVVAGSVRLAALTFRAVRSTYPPPAAGPLIADIRRGFEIPEQSSPHAGSTFRRGLGVNRSVRILAFHILVRLTTDTDI